MLQIVMGTDTLAVRDEILKQISKDVAGRKAGRIYMVPELISHDTERRLCMAAGDTASRYAEVLSFTRLASRVADEYGHGDLECLDNGGRVVAMAAAARQLHSRLKVYASVETKPEFLISLVEMVDEFKRCCISPADLTAAAESAEGTLAQKLTELGLLLEAYDSLCSRGKRDPRDRENLLLEQLEDCDFAERHTFYIDGFPDYTRQHMAILEHLIRRAPNVTVGVNCDQADSGAMAFEKAGATAGDLLRCAKRAGVEVEILHVRGREDDLSRACHGLFQGKVPGHLAGIKAYQAEGIQEEVLCAAEQVLALVEGGCRYRDIGVVVGDMGRYGDLVDLQFHRCRIPVYRSGKEDILQKAGISTVLSALDAALGGFEQRDVLRYLKSALSPVDVDLCDQMENYAVIWGVRGKHWHQPWQNHPDGLSELWTDGARRRLDRLEAARKKVMAPLASLAEAFANARNLGEQVRGIYDLLEQTNYAQRLADLAREMDDRGDNRSAQILNQLWEILVGALEQMHDVLGETVWDAETFTRLFTLLLSQYDVGTIPPVLDAVTVGTPSTMRCQQVRHLIVLGAEEGSLPGYGGSTGLLSDQERVALRNLGLTLTGGAMEGIQAEFAEIYGVFNGATESVSVYCSGAQPSHVFRRVSQMAGGTEEVHGHLGAALRDQREAGAYLARWAHRDGAVELGVVSDYDRVRKQADFAMGTISPENVRGLYGPQLRLSASQVDRQAECRMSYFLKYGLRAKERKEATVDPAEFGTYVHAVLEQTARKVMELGGFEVVSLEETLAIAMEYSDAYGAEHFAGLDSARLSYLFRRNRRELEMVVAELWKELKQSRFRPDDFELQFGEGGRMAAIAIEGALMPAYLRGVVDRVDIWNEDGRNYFRVVDYKTGKKDFDYCDVLNGVGLQMLLYLFALEHGEYGTGAGVQYFPARVPLLSAEGRLTEEEAEQLRQKEWLRRGLLLRDEEVLDAMDTERWKRLCATRKKDGTVSGDLADREQMGMLRIYVFHLLAAMVDQIASGNVEANPYTRGSSHDACTFCPYGAICHKETVEGRRNFKAVKADEFWETIRREVGNNG